MADKIEAALLVDESNGEATTGDTGITNTGGADGNTVLTVSANAAGGSLLMTDIKWAESAGSTDVAML
jgi:hypothetical protein